jgi:hypothetical protein
MCNHLFVDGFGGMGDALVCCKCGLDNYPEAMPLLVLIAAAQRRIIRETHPDYLSFVTKAQRARDVNDSAG